MTDLPKIVYAKSFIDKLANGINPLNDTPIPEGDVARTFDCQNASSTCQRF